jgi:hypothetical protein
MPFTVRGQTRIPAGELREAELNWRPIEPAGSRGADCLPVNGTG